MHDIVRFHKVHGTAIVLSDNGSVANRKGDFGNGIVFSDKPLKVGQKVCLELVQTSEWSGAIRFGVTTQDPAKTSAADLPPFACPHLTNKEGVWARGLNENYAATGTRLTFYINRAGQMHYFVNNEHKGVFLNHLPTNNTMWALFDVYGNTCAAKFVPSDEAPVEILARGPDAMRAYHTACECGTQPAFRTRLMLVGQDRVGKTSLKRALTGQRHNSEEQSTEGIDLSSSCSFNLRDRKAWKLAVRGGGGGASLTQKLEQEQQDHYPTDGGTESLEEEYHHAIASNIVQELLYRQRQQEQREQQELEQTRKHEAHGGRSSAHQSTSRSHRDKRRKETGSAKSTRSLSMPDDLRSHALLQEMPDRVVQLVESMLQEKEGGGGSTHGHQASGAGGSHRKTSAQCGKNIVLNIWDFAGQAAYLTTHQVFLSSRAVYIIVFNLCHELDTKCKLHGTPREGQPSQGESELTDLGHIDYWMNSIHAHTAQNTRNSVDNTTLSPPIFIVGTHRNSLHPEPQVQAKVVEEKFEQIREFTHGKPYERHVVQHFYAVENNMDSGAEDEQMIKLRRHIEEVASKEPYMGEQMPIRWLKFEHAVNKLVEEGTNFSSLDQIKEVAKMEGITDNQVKTLLEFYHDLGVIIYYGGSGTLDSTLRNTVILKPQWLVDMFKRVTTGHHPPLQTQAGSYRELWHRLESTGILEEQLINLVWADVLDQKPALLGLMGKFDLICERLPPKLITSRVTERHSRSYYVPSRLDRASSLILPGYQPSKHDVIFYMDFNGFLPEGLFHRVLTRAIRWSQECGGHEPQLSHRKVRFFLDPEHDFVLEMAALHLARIKITVQRMEDLDDSEESSNESLAGDRSMPPPKPVPCAKVRNFLESALSELRELWMKRISYRAVVQCHCEKLCTTHDKMRCADETCEHFLNLDECLSNKIVCCEHRRIKTAPYRKWFPEPTPVVKSGPVLPDSLVDTVDQTYGNIEAHKGAELPSWVKSAAKLLNGGCDGQDWTALGKKLGYKKNKIDKFSDDLNPGLALITDWIIVSGNTSLSVDMMVTYLEQMQRDDIVEIIQKGQESETEPAQVFISYQWDSQEEVNVLRDKLEKSGFTCWMDIGQMGGGDLLYSRIDEAIRNCKVVIACLTPKYVVSHHCNREISLADLLRKPIIPVMQENIPWPPPGGMSLVFAQLCYINMKGVGGHGGSGIHADLQNKYQEIIQRVSCYVAPHICPKVDLSPHNLNKGDHFFADPSVHSGSLRSGSPSADMMLIPGYGSDHSGQTPRLLTGPSTGNMAATRRNTGDSGQGLQRNQVEQVHVAKCAVCTIL